MIRVGVLVVVGLGVGYYGGFGAKLWETPEGGCFSRYVYWSRVNTAATNVLFFVFTLIPSYTSTLPLQHS